MFDFDNVKASVQEKACRTHRVRQVLNDLRNVNINDIVSNDIDLGEDEIIAVMTTKISIQAVNNLRKTLQHVPANITRVTETPMRSSMIYEVFKSLRSANLSMEEIEAYSKILESRCPVFMSVNDPITDIDFSSDKDLLVKYLTPPVSICMRCDKRLSMRNNPSRAVLFTLRGPVRCAKVTLECRDCSIRYGVCNYTDKCGTRFYPQDFDIDLIEVSNVTYLRPDLYQWMPSLR
jgi:hypothetical protein